MTFWSDVGRPHAVGSPMVDQSEYAFRQLCRRYGTQLCYTPMLHAKVFLSDPTYRHQRLDMDLLDLSNGSPVVVQFAGHEPQELLEAAKLVETHATAVDLNLGCPQPIARKGHYGSFLLRDPDTIVRICQIWSQNLSIPFTCKIRIIDEGSKNPDDRGLQATLRLVDQIEAAGAAALTVHGRNRLMTGKKTGSADWNAIACIKQRTSMPVIANGNIECFDDVASCLETTGADAVMSAEALLENPALFRSSSRICPFQLAHEYLELARTFPAWNFHRVEKAHIVRLLYCVLRQVGPDAQALIASCSNIDELEHSVDEIQQKFSAIKQRGEAANYFNTVHNWYRRHRDELVETNRQKRKEVQQMWLAGGLRLTR